MKSEVCIMVPLKDEEFETGNLSILPRVSQVEELEWKPRLVGFKVPSLFTLPIPQLASSG